MKRPRCDLNGVGEYEVTVTSERHAQAERTKKQKREEKATSWGRLRIVAEGGNGLY